MPSTLSPVSLSSECSDNKTHVVFIKCCRNMEVNRCIRVQVPSMEEAKIRDTIGAGDSFIAGFLQSVAVDYHGETNLRGAIEKGVSSEQRLV